MEIRYGVIGKDRKALIEAIAEINESNAIYKGVPTCNYEIDLEKYIEESNDINILVSAFYNKEIRTGTYSCLLIYKQHMKLIEDTLQNVISANHVMVLGLIETVKHIKIHDVNFCIISTIHIGFKGVNKNKGLYFNEVNEIVDIVENQGNHISSITIPDGLMKLKGS